MNYPNLRAEMARIGLSSKKLGEMCGYGKDGMYQILSGKRKLSFEMAVKIRNAAFPDKRIDYLFGDGDKEDV